MSLVNEIPVALDPSDWSLPVEVDYAADATAWAFFNGSSPYKFSDEVRRYYALCIFDNEVKNGGHSQLIHNLLVLDQLWVLDEFPLGAEMIGAKGFSALSTDYLNWLIANPEIAGRQTGFEGGRAPELDDFDNAYMDLDDNLLPELTQLKNASVDPTEIAFLDNCVDRIGVWTSDLVALRIMWLKHSGLVKFVSPSDRDRLIADTRDAL
jgi:hypothetical protein